MDEELVSIERGQGPSRVEESWWGKGELEGGQLGSQLGRQQCRLLRRRARIVEREYSEYEGHSR